MKPCSLQFVIVCSLFVLHLTESLAAAVVVVVVVVMVI
jgi:hypothetical protein